MTEIPSESSASSPPERPDPVSRLMVLAIVVVLVVAGAFIASAFVPRWWAQRIGDQVDGSMLRGIGAGLFYGFVFTVLPTIVLRWTFRRRRSWKLVLWALALAVVLALPNLMTLSIVVGSGNAAHAGDRILDVDGPGFRYATAIGALVAIGLWVWTEYLMVSRRRSRRRADALREQLEERATPTPQALPRGDDT